MRSLAGVSGVPVRSGLARTMVTILAIAPSVSWAQEYYYAPPPQAPSGYYEQQAYEYPDVQVYTPPPAPQTRPVRVRRAAQPVQAQPEVPRSQSVQVEQAEGEPRSQTRAPQIESESARSAPSQPAVESALPRSRVARTIIEPANPAQAPAQQPRSTQAYRPAAAYAFPGEQRATPLLETRRSSTVPRVTGPSSVAAPQGLPPPAPASQFSSQAAAIAPQANAFPAHPALPAPEYPKGEEIQQVQELLLRLGFNLGSPDGTLGPKTEAALREFQSKHGVAEPTVLGPTTRETLQKVATEKAKTVVADSAVGKLMRYNPTATTAAPAETTAENGETTAPTP